MNFFSSFFLLFLSLSVFSQQITYDSGKPFISFYDSEIEISMNLDKERQYGKYYVADIAIYNNTGRALNFNPNLIKAIYFKNDKTTVAHILSNSEYMKKVKNRQTWQAVALAMSEYSEASEAGKITNNTTSRTNGSYSGTTNTNYFNNYCENLGSSKSKTNLYGSSTTNTTTTTIDGRAKYLAEQNADRKVKEFTSKQHEISSMLNKGYLKRHTIKNREYLRGNLNIKFKKVDKIEITVPINGNEYLFIWDHSILNN